MCVSTNFAINRHICYFQLDLGLEHFVVHFGGGRYICIFDLKNWNDICIIHLDKIKNIKPKMVKEQQGNE